MCIINYLEIGFRGQSTFMEVHIQDLVTFQKDTQFHQYFVRMTFLHLSVSVIIGFNHKNT